MKKIKTILLVLIISLSLAIVALAANSTRTASTGFSFNWNFFNRNSDISLVLDETYDSSSITSIDIGMVSEDILVTRSTDDTIQIKYYGSDKDDVTLKQNGSTLSLQRRSNTFFIFNFSFSDGRVELSLPDKVYDQITFDSTSGTITSIDLEGKSIQIDSTSGELNLESLKATQIDLETVSGGIKVASATGDLSVQSVSGDIQVDHMSGELDGETTSGRITINDFTMTNDSSLQSVSGSITLEMNSASSEFSVEADSLSGRINSAYGTGQNKNNLTLEIETTSGNITVE